MSVKSFYQSQFLRSLAEAMISPFLSVYLLFLGATKALIGLASTLPNLASLLSQLFWGSFSESTHKKRIFIIFGGLAWALMWIPIALVKDPLLLVFLLAFQALLSSASAPAWTSLLIRIVPSYRVAQVQGNLNAIGNFANLIGTLVAGLILNNFGFTPFIFYIITFLGIMSRVPFFHTKDVKMISNSDKSLLTILKRAFNFSRIKNEKELIKLITAITFLNFSVSLAAPFLSVYVVTGLGGSVINIAMLSIIAAITTIIFSRPWGIVIDRIGKKFVMLACIIPASFIPLIYAISPRVEWVYYYEVVGAMSWAGFNLATFAYLANILPKEKTDSSISFYNLFAGLGSSFGPIVGGILSEFIGFQNLFFLSTSLRLFTIALIERLEEKPCSRPRFSGIFFEFFGLGYRIENFVSTYSLVMTETLRQSIDFFNFKKHLKLASFSLRKGSKLLKQRLGKKTR
ncbi:MAG: MFS transporter [Candidatus Aenigmatarchaeota archaeon]